MQRGADLCQAAEMRQHICIHMIPIEREATERVGIALHADLVAIIDAGNAEDGEQQHRRRLDALFRSAAGAFAQFCITHFILRIGVDAAQRRQDARRVVRSEDIHERIENGLRIIVPQHRDRLAEQRRVTAEDKLDDRILERVIHHAVQLLAPKIFAALAVCDLVGGVLPNFPQHHGFRIGHFDGLADLFNKLVGEFVRHIQAKAAQRIFQPISNDPVFARYVIGVRRTFFIDGGQIIDPPPRAVFFRIMDKIIPRIVLGIFGLIGADARVAAVFIEIQAVVPGMIEHAVEHDADAALAALFDEPGKLLFRAERRIDLHKIARIVAVVGEGTEDRVQIQDGDVQTLQVIEFFEDAADIAAEKVVVEDLPLGVHAILGGFVPTLVQPFFGRDAHFAAAVKAVGEDLIHDTALQPGRRPEPRFIDEDLIERGRSCKFQVAQLSAARFSPVVELEIIEIQPRIRQIQEQFPAVRNFVHTQILSPGLSVL